MVLNSSQNGNSARKENTVIKKVKNKMPNVSHLSNGFPINFDGKINKYNPYGRIKKIAVPKSNNNPNPNILIVLSNERSTDFKDIKNKIIRILNPRKQ